MKSPKNDGITATVKQTPGSIGYMEYGFARRLGLPMALLQKKAGEFVKPDANSGRAALAAAATSQLPDDLRLFLPDPEGANSYPIASLSWMRALMLPYVPNGFASLPLYRSGQLP